MASRFSLLSAMPLTLEQANILVSRWHRHHKPAQGYRFAIGCLLNGKLVGAAIVGRPVARMIPAYQVAEITRLVTDGSSNVCSFLYGRCARVAKEMGFHSIQTYILKEELGASLKAAGYVLAYESDGGDWNSKGRKRRIDQPQDSKKCWRRELRSDPAPPWRIEDQLALEGKQANLERRGYKLLGYAKQR